MPKVDQQEAEDRTLSSPSQTFSTSNPPSPRIPSPKSPAPQRPQQHCLACREGKQSFLMNHPPAFFDSFHILGPESLSQRPYSIFDVLCPNLCPDSHFSCCATGAWNFLRCHLIQCSTSETRSPWSAHQGDLLSPHPVSSSSSPSHP